MRIFFLLSIFFAAPALADDKGRGFLTIDIAGISDQGRKIEGRAWVQPGARNGDFCVTLGADATCAGRFSTVGASKIRRMDMVCSNGMKAVAEMEMEKTPLFGLFWPSKGRARSGDGDRSDLSFSALGLRLYPPDCAAPDLHPAPGKDEGADRLFS